MVLIRYQHRHISIQKRICSKSGMSGHQDSKELVEIHMSVLSY